MCTIEITLDTNGLDLGLGKEEDLLYQYMLGDIMTNKRSSLKAHLAVLALVFLVSTGSTAIAAGQYMSVAKDGVNIRSKPATDAEILWRVPKGFPLEILERKAEWVHTVDSSGDKGWVHISMLAKDKTVIVRTKANDANIRVGPGTNYEIVVQAENGVMFAVLEKNGEWLNVKHADGTTGWIHSTVVWPAN